jgi:hypothetical protein
MFILSQSYSPGTQLEAFTDSVPVFYVLLEGHIPNSNMFQNCTWLNNCAMERLSVTAI